MNTQKTVSPSEFFAARQERFAFLRAYKALARAKQLTAADVLLRALVLGQDPYAAFTPITNSVKLANGQDPSYGLAQAKTALLSMDASKSHLLARLYREQAQAEKHPDIPQFAKRVERAKAHYEAPLPVEVRWGANLADHTDYSRGLSIAALMKAQDAVRQGWLTQWPIPAAKKGGAA